MFTMRCSLMILPALMPGGLAFSLKYRYAPPATTTRPAATFQLMMVGFGQSNRRAQLSPEAKQQRLVKERTAEETTPVVAGELPEDAFSQFPPLSHQQQSTLKPAPELPKDGGELPAEVRVSNCCRAEFMRKPDFGIITVQRTISDVRHGYLA